MERFAPDVRPRPSANRKKRQRASPRSSRWARAFVRFRRSARARRLPHWAMVNAGQARRHCGLSVGRPLLGLISCQKLGIDPTLQATVLHLGPVPLPACRCEPRAFWGGAHSSPGCCWSRPNVYTGALQENDILVLLRRKSLGHRGLSGSHAQTSLGGRLGSDRRGNIGRSSRRWFRCQKLGIDPTLQATVLHLDPVPLPTCSCEPRAFGGGANSSPGCCWSRPNVYTGALQENDLLFLPWRDSL